MNLGDSLAERTQWNNERPYVGLRLIEFDTGLVQFRYDQCRHERIKFHGAPTQGKQRLRCMLCLKYFTEDARDDHLTRIRVLAPLFKAGVVAWTASKQTGYCYKAVRRYYRLFREFRNKSARPQSKRAGR